KEQIFGADEPRTGAKQPRSIRLNAMQSGKGRNSTSSRSANLPRPLMVGAFFRSGLGGSRPSMRISIWAPQIGTTSAPFSLSGIGGSNGGGQLLLGACNAHWSLGVLNRFTAFSCDLLR